MNNLHRELAPISDAAWAEIEEETTRTLKRYLAGRRVVDVPAPTGVGLDCKSPSQTTSTRRRVRCARIKSAIASGG